MGAPCSKEEAYRRAAPLVRRLVEKHEARLAALRGGVGAAGNTDHQSANGPGTSPMQQGAA